MAGAVAASCHNGRVNQAVPQVPQSGVWVERTGPATYRGVSASGARVLIGRDGAGPVFTPGELLQLALAACSAMSSDARLTLALGPDFQAITQAVPTKHGSDDRYTSFTETMTVDLSGLDAETRAKTEKLALSSIANNCTVGNTIMAGAEVPPLEFVQP